MHVFVNIMYVSLYKYINMHKCTYMCMHGICLCMYNVVHTNVRIVCLCMHICIYAYTVLHISMIVCM